ncbi:MAG: hypothetical protein WDN06_08535 [Asticcacaulis sp.]
MSDLIDDLDARILDLIQEDASLSVGRPGRTGRPVAVAVLGAASSGWKTWASSASA